MGDIRHVKSPEVMDNSIFESFASKEISSKRISAEDFTKSEADDRLVTRLNDLHGVSADLTNEANYLKDCNKIISYKEFQEELRNCNPNFQMGYPWKVNCQRCVPAFEMRCRGYDVTAQPRPTEDMSKLSRQPFLVWENPEVIFCRGDGLEDIKTNMEKWGDGARAQIVVVWKNLPSGHTFTAEQVNGKTIFYDPQTGSTDVTRYFSRVEPNMVRLCRIDNLDVTDKILDCCKKEVK